MTEAGSLKISFLVYFQKTNVTRRTLSGTTIAKKLWQKMMILWFGHGAICCTRMILLLYWNHHGWNETKKSSRFQHSPTKQISCTQTPVRRSIPLRRCWFCEYSLEEFTARPRSHLFRALRKSPEAAGLRRGVNKIHIVQATSSFRFAPFCSPWHSSSKLDSALGLRKNFGTFSCGKKKSEWSNKFADWIQLPSIKE